MVSDVFETHLLEIERKTEWDSDKHGTFENTLSVLH